MFSIQLVRSSRQEVFWKKIVLTNFAKFNGKYLRWSLFVKLQAFTPLTL